MAKYSVNNTLAGTQQNLASTYKSLTSVSATSGSLRRGKIYDVTVGIDGAPNATDCSIDWDMSQITALGTATAATPVALDQADVAALTTGNVNATVEPTVTSASSAWTIGANQRATYRWAAVPGSEIVWPATTAHGYTLRGKSATYGSTAVGQILFDEQ